MAYRGLRLFGLPRYRQLERSFILSGDGLSGLAPASIQKAVCCGYAGRWRGFERIHDTSQGVDCRLCVASRQRPNITRSFSHLGNLGYRLSM